MKSVTAFECDCCGKVSKQEGVIRLCEARHSPGTVRTVSAGECECGGLTMADLNAKGETLGFWCAWCGHRTPNNAAQGGDEGSMP